MPVSDQKCTAENAPPIDDDIDDPYEPLEHDRPGPLAEKPFKLKMPTKRTCVKVFLYALLLLRSLNQNAQANGEL